MNLLNEDEVAAFRNSGHFDEQWYVEQYPDVKIVGMDPAKHFLWLGARLGRLPSVDFDTAKLSQIDNRAKLSKRVVDRHLNSFNSTNVIDFVEVLNSKNTNEVPRELDFRVQLLAESTLLDVEFVCKQLNLPFYTDRVSVARMYYSKHNDFPMRPNPLFDPEYYRHANALGYKVDPIEHYLIDGAKRHLPSHYLFDADWYKSQVEEAVTASDLIEHYWSVGYKRKILPMNPAKFEIVPEISRMFFLDEKDDCYEDFDPWIYKLCNADMAGTSDADLFAHYSRFGKGEGRVGSMVRFFASCQSLPRFIPIDFTPKGYTDVHLDISQAFPENSIQTLVHYLSNGLSEGRAYSLRQLYGYFSPSDRKFSVELIDTQKKTPLCVLMHLFYPEMWNELRSYVSNIEVPYDLCVNLVESTWTTEILGSIRREFPNSKIHISSNAGRDIGGFVRLMDCVDFNQYIAFALVHSKKSPHVTEAYASRWKDSLLSSILGSSDIVAQNVAAFIEDSSIGIIGSAQNRHTMVAKNAGAFNYLLNLYGIDEEHRGCEYISGTMMMVRSELMREIYNPIKEIDFKSGDGKDLSFHIDGQFEHAVERIFGNVMKQNDMQFLWR